VTGGRELLAAHRRLKQAGWSPRDITPSALVAEMERAQIEAGAPSPIERPSVTQAETATAEVAHGDCEMCGGELPRCGCSVIK
jgi:hypothetical protein